MVRLVHASVEVLSRPFVGLVIIVRIYLISVLPGFLTALFLTIAHRNSHFASNRREEPFPKPRSTLPFP